MINKQSLIPLYSQLVDEIVRQIDEGELSVNSKLPAEREMCIIYSVSRTTVRQAIQELERLGCVVCIHGKGNFVTGPIMRQQLLTIYSFSEETRKLGKVPSTKLVSHQRIGCEIKIAQELNIERGAPVYQIIRVRLADDEPVMLVTTYLPVSRFPGLDAERLANTSLYGIMIDEYGLNLSEVQESMQAVAMRKDEASLLSAAAGDPAMMIRRRSFEGDKPIEYAVGIALGDKFKYEVVLKN